MWRYLILLSLVLTACRSAPLPIAYEPLPSLTPSKLCQRAGQAFAINDADDFHAVMTEISGRADALPTSECIALAQITMNAVMDAQAQAADRRQRAAALVQSGFAEAQRYYQSNPGVIQVPPPPPKQKPVVCTTNGNQTTCNPVY